MYIDVLLNHSSILESMIPSEIAAVSIDTVEECVGDPFEFLTGVYYENEMVMKNIEQAIMVCEYAYLKDTGSEMVYESNVITNMFDNVGKAISKAWDQICAFFKSIYRQLDEFKNANKAWVIAMRGNLVKLATKTTTQCILDCSKVKIYSYDEKSSGAITINLDTSRILDIAKELFDNISSRAKEIEESYIGTSDVYDDDMLNIGKFKASIIGADMKGNMDFKRKLVTMFRGDQLKTVLLTTRDIKDIIDEIDSYKKTKISLDNMYTSTKKIIKLLLDQAKKAKNDFMRDQKNSKDAKQNESKIYHNSARALNALVSLLTLVNSTACRAITDHARQSKTLAMHATSAMLRNG